MPAGYHLPRGALRIPALVLVNDLQLCHLPFAMCNLLSAIGYRRSATGYWLSATGHRPSAIGYQLLTIAEPWRSSAGAPRAPPVVVSLSQADVCSRTPRQYPRPSPAQLAP